MARASWQYDEMCQTGVDFENVDRVAQYDEQQGSDREAERELVKRLVIIPGHVVLDLGCGTGSFACEAARSGAQVRAIDVSKAMLEFVQGTALREGIFEIKVEHSGFLTLEASPNSVDVVVSRYALHHLPDFWKQVALLRLREVLRPTGKFYLRDVVFSFEAEDYEALSSIWARMRIAELADRATWDRTVKLGDEVKALALRHSLMSAFTSFVAVDSLTRTAGAYGTSVNVPVPVADGMRYETTVAK